MKQYLLQLLVCLVMLLDGAAGVCATFNERLWEKYAPIELPESGRDGSLVALPLDVYRFDELTAEIPFADFRVVSDRKEELPWQMVSKRPETGEEAVAGRMSNLSTTASGDTWAELLVEAKGDGVNALRIVTPETGYIRQVEVLGSADGKTWQSIRKDGVIFDLDKEEKLKNDRLSIPETTFPHLAIRITNDGKSPLKITEVRLLRQRSATGETFVIPATTGKPELDDLRKESRIIVRLEKSFPVDRLLITTKESNFQRSVTVEAKNRKGAWEPVATGVIYSFDSPGLHSSQLSIAVPELSAREFRLVFRNHDSPPLTISNVSGEGYRRILVFKNHPERKLFLFWGNPSAVKPQYDLAGAVTTEAAGRLPLATLGQERDNPAFAGDKARMPFSERYRVVLYLVVILAIAGLLFMQYRVFRRISADETKPKAGS
jgi:hypothetical protein